MLNGSYVLDSVAKAGKITGLKDKDADSKSTYYIVHIRGLKGVLYFNDKGVFVKIHKPKFKRHCKKLRHLDLLKSIKLYIEENHPDHFIAHARKVITKDWNVFFLVKLVSSDKKNFVVLKFDKDGTLFHFNETWGPWFYDVLFELSDGKHDLLVELANLLKTLDADWST